MKRFLLSAIALLLLLSGVAMLASCDDDSMEDSSFKPVSTSVETGGDSSSVGTKNNETEDATGSAGSTEDTTSATTSGDQWSQDRK
jgi:hypothetical protein